MSIGAALPVLPLFVRGPLHASNLAVGIVVGAFSVTSVFCRPLAGRFADNRGRKIVLVVSAFVMSLGGVLYLLAGSIAGLILARLVVGMGEGALYTAGATWAVDLAPVRHRGLALGVFGLAVWGGLSLGPLVGELLRAAGGYDAVWVLAAALPFAGALIALCLPEPSRAFRGRVSERLALFPRAARRPGVALALANFGYAALAGFVVLDLSSHGVSGGASVFTVFAAAVFLSRIVLSPLPDRAGPRATATGAALFEAVGLAIIAFAHTLAGALAGRAGDGARLLDAVPGAGADGRRRGRRGAPRVGARRVHGLLRHRRRPRRSAGRSSGGARRVPGSVPARLGGRPRHRRTGCLHHPPADRHRARPGPRANLGPTGARGAIGGLAGAP